MARFQNLSQVGAVLAAVIGDAVAPGADVRLNVPFQEPNQNASAVRITLAWVTPQPGHRNDPPERNPDGTLAPPPPTLSAWYVVTCYGATDTEDAIGAHDLLGQIIRAFHAQPLLELPIDTMGEGLLQVVQVPLDAEMNEKIWSSFQVRQRPWLLLDVGPIQLVRGDGSDAQQPLVRPGGIRLSPIDVADRPRIARISPSAVGVGGRVRIDASYTGAPSVVSVGETRVVPPDIEALEDGGPVLLRLPATVAEDAYDLTLTGMGNVPSEPATLTVLEAARPSLDAPDELRHSRAVPLVLTGRALDAGASNVVFWPEAGVNAPSDVVTMAGVATPNSITIAPVDLNGLRNTTYRISLQFSDHGYTPYVLLEMTA